MAKFVLALALLACFLNYTCADEAADYRLVATDAVPSKYTILLELENGADGKTLKNTFIGTVNIDLVKDPKNKFLRLHCSEKIHSSIKTVTYCDKLIVTNPKLKETDEVLAYNNETEIITISIPDGANCGSPAGEFLKIEYEGELYNDMYGFYISTFGKDTSKVTFATTQFQPTYARRAFPCFDEPSIKAKFDITIKHPTGYTAMSNQIGEPDVTSDKCKPATGTKAETAECTKFKLTPKMSTYLVAFIVYPKDTYTCENIVRAVPGTVPDTKMQVCAPTVLKESMAYAKDHTEKIIDELNKFTGISYHEMSENTKWGTKPSETKETCYTDGTTSVVEKMEQLNQVAIPDFAAGAMENWGLVTYRETALLHDKDESTWRDKQRIASVIAHEFAHMWFGNLVTLKWWESSWMNEGFARYFEYHTINAVKTEWEMASQFVIEQMHSIFQTDVTGSLPLTSTVNTQTGIKAKFGSVTYNKGACVLRMFEHAIGKDQFQKGIQKYLCVNKYTNTEPKNIFEALTDNKGQQEQMEKWTKQAGYPVVHVSIKEKKLIFEQEQFHYQKPAEKAELTWPIPISYYFDGSPDSDKTTTPKLLLTIEKDDSTAVTDAQKDKFIVVNVDQTGYYRVHYENDLMILLETALKSTNFGKISDINRAQFVDDTFNLARVGKVLYDDAFLAIAYLKEEKSYYPWYAAFNGFSYLRRRLPEGDLKKNVTVSLASLMTKVYDEVKNFEDLAVDDAKQIQMYKKVLVLQWACEINKGDCRKDAMTMYGDNEGKLEETPKGKVDPILTETPPNLRKIVYCEAARSSAANWDKIWALYDKTDSAAKKVTILTALGCSEDKDKLNKFLKMSITATSNIRKQDAYSVFTSVLTGTPTGVNVALEFLIAEYKNIRDNYGSLNALSTVITAVADRLTTSEQATKFSTFLDAEKDNLDDAKDVLELAKNTVTANNEWVTTYEETLMKHFGFVKGAGNHLVSLSLSALFFLALSVNYLF